MKKKILALILALLLALALGAVVMGCGGSNESEPPLTLEEEREDFVDSMNFSSILPRTLDDTLTERSEEIDRLFNEVNIINIDSYNNEIDRHHTEMEEGQRWRIDFEFTEDTLNIIVLHGRLPEVSRVNRENFELLEVGMSMEDVVAIFGYEGTAVTGQGGNAVREFADGNRASDGLITIEFSENAVVSFSQFGL